MSATLTLPLPAEKLEILRRGVAIPAVPLALDAQKKLSEKHQRALLRYYAAAGAGGVAVGVHTTQFEIREPQFNLFRPVLELAADEIKRSVRPLFAVAGACGRTTQAVAEAELARSLGFDAVLLSLGAMRDATDSELVTHCRTVADVIPVIGFYLQPAVGGRVLPFSFWREFAEIPNVIAIKMAPFNRYQTIDVVQAVALAGRADNITLYTGNDDNIIIDLLTPFTVGSTTVRIKGGLLGQWSVWTSKAVALLQEIHGVVERGGPVPLEMIRRNAELTDANAVVFDAANAFRGCIPGINEVLRRQGLLTHSHCLTDEHALSPGQTDELDRIYREYPWLTDDEFVAAHKDKWLQ